MLIFVRDLTVQMLIGIYPREHKTPQDVVVNIEANVIEPEDWRNDSMDDWVSYEGLVSAVQEIIGDGHISLLETFAHRIAGVLLSNKRISSIKIRLEKTTAIPGTRSVGVVYEQSNV